jgi:hypothetical protein
MVKTNRKVLVGKQPSQILQRKTFHPDKIRYTGVQRGPVFVSRHGPKTKSRKKHLRKDRTCLIISKWCIVRAITSRNSGWIRYMTFME